MQTINSILTAIQAAGLNHKQVAQTLIADQANKLGDLGYPCLRVFPNGLKWSNLVDNNVLYYKFSLSVTDRTTDTDNGKIEALSDTASILIGVVASLEYIYRATPVRFEIDGDVQPYIEVDPDKCYGHEVELRVKAQYLRDFCSEPSHDFDFPAINLSNQNVIDEGNSETTYQSILIVEGGSA